MAAPAGLLIKNLRLRHVKGKRPPAGREVGSVRKSQRLGTFEKTFDRFDGQLSTAKGNGPGPAAISPPAGQTPSCSLVRSKPCERRRRLLNAVPGQFREKKFVNISNKISEIGR
jgi:hypothetical protein